MKLFRVVVLFLLVLSCITMADVTEEVVESEAVAPPETGKTVAFFASPSKVEALMGWIQSNYASLDGSTLVAPVSLVVLLKLDMRTAWLPIEALTDETDEDSGVEDITVAGQVLEGKVKGVIFFYDPADKGSVPDFDLLVRACNHAKVPVAINEETANLALRGVFKTRTAYLIFNPVAGQGDSDAQLAQIRSILEPQMVLHIVLTQKDRDPADQAREIVNMIKGSPDYDPDGDNSDNILIASGGDGTVSAIAGATMGTGIPFGVIPRGTANAFSVALGIPVPLILACRNILGGNVRTVDGAQCNDVPMILLAGVGFEAGMVKNAPRELKNVIGPLAYILGGAKQVVDQQPFKCRLKVDDQEQSLQTTAITVANVAPPTSVLAQGFGDVIPDDGLLDVTIATSQDLFSGLRDLASLVGSAVVKEPTNSESLLCVRAKSLTVDCDPAQTLVIDGELLDVNPITFSIIPNGLKVITPKEKEDTF